MSENTGKPPIDDLFARKLGKMSLPPSPDGFERLQARMGQRQAEPRLVVWRNPTVQRALALAACLLLVCLFGWLYLRSDNGKRSGEAQVATNRNIEKPGESTTGEPQTATSPSSGTELEPTEVTSNQLADARLAETQRLPRQSSSTAQNEGRAGSISELEKIQPQPGQKLPVEQPVEKSILAQQQPVSTDEKTQFVPNKTEMQTEAVAVAPPKVAPAERVLVVTIAEPATLTAARQVAEKATEKAVEKAVVASVEKSEKEPKANGFWQQVQRVKKGEIFASRHATDDELGLLGRAYSGLKSNFDKEKPAKQ
ncbi:hypothetical protein [Spirosoma montaniterrae]|uniref:Uncharacterized protein n=1 Tax=Spirosoma montaniterrae TaxID=1178516 RepID=A0A1P9X3A4_9BACT|nr:hypothetical protein [Spirosoma montaniterrae]AQG82093.1 hypothetical protein AWR27_24020 [Spirosoma montaniterrae]